jgi:hypothetical protein
MLAALALALAMQQDSIADVPVYEDRGFGIAVPRPFEDWVFVPSRERNTTTIIFHPRAGALSDQLWGALVLTRLATAVPIRELAERRLATAWRPQMGRSFTLVARESVEVAGLPAMRLLVSGVIERAVLEVEELLIVRGTDLALLQLRYPRGLPRDSIAAGYARTLAGLTLRGAPPATVAARADHEPARRWDALRESPWTPVEVDALVRAEVADGPRRFRVRLDLVNDHVIPADSVVLWLPAGTVLDGARHAGRRLAALGQGQTRRVLLPAPVAPGERTSLTLEYRGAATAQGWLPQVQAPTDSLGEPRRHGTPRASVTVDVPDSLRAVATGRLVAEALAAGRRRVTWASEAASDPALVIGALALRTLVRDGVRVHVWVPPDQVGDTAGVAALAGRVHAAWRALWRAFGPVPVADVHAVETGAPATRGTPGLVLLGADAHNPAALVRALARTWWGGHIKVEGPGATHWLDAVTAWAAQRLAEAADSTGPGRLLEAVRRAIGEPALREALRTMAAEARTTWLSMDDVALLLGPQGAVVLRRGLR